MGENIIKTKMNESKQRTRIAQLIIHEFAELIELYPQYTFAQHISYLTDRKNFYRMSNEQALKELEKYKSKLEDEVLAGDEIFFEEELN